MNKNILIIVILLLIILLPVVIFSKNETQDSNKRKNEILDNELDNIPNIQKEKEDTNMPKPPITQFDKNKTYTAVLKTTEGNIKILLNAQKTPITVNNFVTLARKNFYNNTIFHRVIKGFMIQGGDPNGDGTGGPGYKFSDESFEGEYKRGTMAMANAGPNTNGSQFFIMHQDYPLPKNYVIFGQVIEGIEVVDKIANTPVKPNISGENSKPVNPITVGSVEIIEE